MGSGVVEVLFGGKLHDSEAPSIFRHVSGLQSECMGRDVRTNSQKEKKRGQWQEFKGNQDLVS